MPREDRRIYFDYAETYKALYGFCFQKEIKKLPAGVITSIDPKPDDNEIILLKIVNSQANKSAEVDFTRDFIAAALMLYCRTINIPLPKKAMKSVDFKDGNVILRVMI